MSVWYDEKRKHWIYKFWKDKESYRKGGFATKSAAAKAERAKRNELDKPPQPTRSISFHEVATLYLQHCAATFQENTVRYKKQYFKTFIATLPDPDTPADRISKQTFQEFLDGIASDPKQGRKLSNRYFKDLKALYNWAVRTDHLKENPLKHIEPKGEDVFRKYVPPPEDINAVLLAATQEEIDLIITIYSTGARISEVCRLTWEDVNLEVGSITLWTRKRKGGGMQADTLKMPMKLQDVMRRRLKARNKESQFVFCQQDGRPWTKDNHFIRKLMPRLCKRAGVKPFGFHSLRHRVALILMDSGKANLREIQEFLRQRRTTTTEIYLRSISPGSGAMADILDGVDNVEIRDKKDESM